MADEPKPPVIIKAFPPAGEYQEAENEFLRALGLCVSVWAFVDRQLFEIFRATLKATTPRAALIYYAPKTLSARLHSVDRLLEQNLSEADYKAHWRPVWKKFDELIPVRNIFVHHPTRRVHTAKDGKPAYEYAIHIEPYERLLGKMPKGLNGKDHIGVEDLKKHAEAVSALEDDLKVLVRKLSR